MLVFVSKASKSCLAGAVMLLTMREQQRDAISSQTVKMAYMICYFPTQLLPQVLLQSSSRLDTPVAAAAEAATAASSKSQKAAAGAAAVAGSGWALVSKSQLKKQRKKALGTEEAAAAADAPGILCCLKFDKQLL